METPNNITFFIASTIQELDQTLEPTIEGYEGTDYLGNTFGDGTQIVNAMDSYSHRYFEAKISGGAWRVDTELDEREKAGFIMVDQHNLRSVYAAATKEQIDMHHNTVDTFGTSTQSVMKKEMSGLLGENSYMELDGVVDKVTVSDSAELKFGIGSFSLELLFKMNTLTDGAVIFSKKDDLDDDLEGWLIHYRSSDNTFVFKASDGSTDYSVSSGTNQKITAGVLYHLVCIRDSTTPLQIMYVNSVVSTDSRVDNQGDVSNASDMILGNDDSGSHPSHVDIYHARLFSRVLSSTEITSFYNGGSILESDKWAGAGVDMLDDNQATSDQLTEGDSVADWDPIDSALASTDVGDDGVAPHNGTYKLSMTNTDTICWASQQITTVVDQKYRFSGWLYDSTTALGNLRLRVGTGLTLTNLGSSPVVDAADTWQYREVEFSATTTQTYFAVYEKGDIADVSFGDNLSVVPIGCVAEYDLSGINKGDGLWYDSSDNDLDGTVTGAKYINIPESNNDYYLGVFSSEANSKFWFNEYNVNGVSAPGPDVKIGQIAFGKAYTFPTQLLPSGGYSGEYAFPGIILNETDTGRFQSEEKFGARPTWDLTFALSTTDQIKDMRDMVEFLKGANYPFWVCFNYDALDPVVWRVRLQGGLNWGYSYGSGQPWSPSISLIKDI